MYLTGLHPFTAWRFQRRIKGGVVEGMLREAVLAKLGAPQEQLSDEGRDIWVYDVGQTLKLDVSYAVLFEGDKVSASWWSEKRAPTES